MRIDLKKMLFYGVKGSLESFFNQAQELGIVEFIDKNKTKLTEVPNDILNLLAAIKVVRTLPTMNQEAPESYADADPMVNRILELQIDLEKLAEKEKEARLKIDEIRPFGNFSMESIRQLEKETGRHFQYFFSKRGAKNPPEIPAELIHVRSDNTFDYYISLSHNFVIPKKMIETKFSQDLQSLEESLEKIKERFHVEEQELKSYSKYNEFLHHVLDYKYNNFSLQAAKKAAQPFVESALFVIEGWVPVNKIDEAKAFVEKMNVHCEEIQADPNDKIPTYLENEGFSKIGEDLVCFYDIPSKSDKDPSLWVLGFFALFFAMIVGDGGYGLVFLATALYLRYKNPDMKGRPKRVWKLFTLLCVSCVAWGLLTNSFFGISLAPDSTLRKISVLNWLAEKKAGYHFERQDPEYHGWVEKYPEIKNAKTPKEFLLGANARTPEAPAYVMISSYNDSALIEIALLFGMIHISFSLIRYIRRNPTGYGWLLAIVGSYFYFPSFLNATSLLHYAFGLNQEHLAQSGYYMIFTGISLALVIAIYQRKLLGILELASITAIFADVLSYLRLYALGLSGSVVTSTINDIAGAIDLTFLAVALWIVGHLINMALSVVGGVIHGLRLNFIEWYHYSFEGGGKAFDPLKKIQIQ